MFSAEGVAFYHTVFDVPDQENYTWNVSWWSGPIFFGKYPEAGLKLFAGDLPNIKPFELISTVKIYTMDIL